MPFITISGNPYTELCAAKFHTKGITIDGIEECVTCRNKQSSTSLEQLGSPIEIPFTTIPTTTKRKCFCPYCGERIE